LIQGRFLILNRHGTQSTSWGRLSISSRVDNSQINDFPGGVIGRKQLALFNGLLDDAVERMALRKQAFFIQIYSFSPDTKTLSSPSSPNDTLKLIGRQQT